MILVYLFCLNKFLNVSTKPIFSILIPLFYNTGRFSVVNSALFCLFLCVLSHQWTEQ